MDTSRGWKSIGRCNACGLYVYKTQDNRYTGHRDTCKNKDSKKLAK